MMRLVAVTTMLFWTTGCCCICFPSGSSRDRSTHEGTSVDLGTARFPDDAPSRRTRVAEWEIPGWTPEDHRVGFALSEAEEEAAHRALQELQREMDVVPTTGRLFRWNTDRCPNWFDCVYPQLLRDSREPLRPLLDRLLAHAGDDLSPQEQLAVVQTFVQQLRYEVPANTLGIRAPVLTAYEASGDCDSGALLLYLFLTEMGYDVVILVSATHKHALLGVAVPTSGTSFRWKGREYALLETAARWPLGNVHPKYLKPWDWQVAPGDR